MAYNLQIVDQKNSITFNAKYQNLSNYKENQAPTNAHVPKLLLVLPGRVPIKVARSPITTLALIHLRITFMFSGVI